MDTGKTSFQKIIESPDLYTDSPAIAFCDSLVNETCGQLVELYNQLFKIYDIDSLTIASLDSLSSLRHVIKDTIWSGMNQVVDSLIVNGEIGEWRTSLMELINELEMLQNKEDSILEKREQEILEAAEIALTSNTSIDAVTILEQNEKLVNEIYIEGTINGGGTITHSQSSYLFAIAKQCPMRGGPIVYVARSLYALIDPLQTFNDEENCLDPSKSSDNIYTNLETNYLMVHPNPADDEILIRCSLPEEAFDDLS
ncbi:MAG: hypothetical protein IPN13_17880 [Bacteroidetes bacterium]|nr:hypothetical protein [Bacteroidota bacterium]